MKFKVGNIARLFPALVQFGQAEGVFVPTANKLALLQKEMQKAYADYLQEHDKLLRELGTQDPQETQKYNVPPENTEEWNKKLGAVQDKDVELDFQMIPLSEIGTDVRLAGYQNIVCELIGFVFVNDQAPAENA